jgi:hypothetical protein
VTSGGSGDGFAFRPTGTVAGADRRNEGRMASRTPGVRALEPHEELRSPPDSAGAGPWESWCYLAGSLPRSTSTSRPHDFRCDALQRIERQQAGKDYWCWWPD